MQKKNNDSSVLIWGTGSPRREFLHVDDLADACYFLLKNYNDEDIINIGCGKDISIKELAELIASIVNYNGEILFDHSKPNGVEKKLLDCGKLTNLGWTSTFNLLSGLNKTINEFINQ